MWVIGAIVASAGMWVYIVWGTVRSTFLSDTSPIWFVPLGPTQEWRREELSRIPFPKTQIPHNMYVCFRRHTFRSVIFFLSKHHLANTVICSLGRRKFTCIRRIHSQSRKSGSWTMDTSPCWLCVHNIRICAPRNRDEVGIMAAEWSRNVQIYRANGGRNCWFCCSQWTRRHRYWWKAKKFWPSFRGHHC